MCTGTQLIRSGHRSSSRESCEKPSRYTKRKKAELHDRMNSRLTQSHVSIVRDKRRGIDFTAAERITFI